ncbi:hypothetical protein BAMBUS_00820 [Brevundimonas phage vB_BpoS-Bambus]|nr:hypothetical protein BAMBUS_00820 [Brevundimonas phage vB_BpoS-Bambus]
MSGTDLRVRAHLTYSVTGYHRTESTGTSRVVGEGFTAEKANEIAAAVHAVTDQPGDLTQMVVSEMTFSLDRRDAPSWLAESYAHLAAQPEGSVYMLERLPASKVRLTKVKPSTAPAFKIDVTGFEIKSVLGNLQTVADTVKDSIMREISRINLPERWEDLSSETTRRGLEAFMAVQTVGKDAWRDHEIEALVTRIALRTGKAKIDLRRMFESAQERVMEAKRILADAVPTKAPLTSREEHYCKNRAKGCTPHDAARYAGFLNDPTSAFNTALLENSPPIQARIAELITAKAPAEATPQALPAGAARLDNATQEFFALNIGFYGMTVEAAAKQMSLPLETADGLMEMPTVKARIKFFQRTLQANVEAFRAEGPQ